MATKAARRLRIAKLVLAGVAFLGIGAAATTAAWTDQVWFKSDATVAHFEMLGSNIGLDGSFVPGESRATAIPLHDPAEDLLFTPGASFERVVWVKNAGTVPATITAITTPIDGPLSEVGLIITATPGKTNLIANEVTTVTVTITAPADLNPAHMGKTGTIYIEVDGQND